MRPIGLVLTTLLVLCGTLVLAQDLQQPPGGATQSQVADATANQGEAPLVYFNRTVTIFRVPLFGVSPEGRARRAVEVMSQLLDGLTPSIVTTQSEPQGNLVLIDGQLAFIIVEGDADRLRGQTLATNTEQTLAALRLVISETREVRDRSRLLRAFLYALGGTLALVAVVSIVVYVRRRLLRQLGRLAERAAAATHFGGAQVVTADRLLPIARQLVSVVTFALVTIAVYEWLSYVLAQFPYTRPWGERLLAFFAGAGADIGQGVLGALPELAIALFILVLARGVTRQVSPFFDRVARGQQRVTWLDADTAGPTKRLMVLGTWLFALAMAYPYLPGSGTEAFQGISVLLGLMVTFGGSSLFAQGASGLILMYSRTLRVGEYVRIDEHEGTVTELGSFTTRVRTGLGEEITLPNALVLGTAVKNYSRTVQGQGYIVDTTVTIGYDTPWRQVEAMLLEAALRTPGVLPSPTPRVFQTALSDFYPEYRLVCQAIPREARPRAEVLATLHANIQDVFNEHGVQIMSPHYLGDPRGPKVVAKADWYTAPAKPPETA
ncbi:MAG TPA: mechanosensitive ion channel family protein [Vicinamibacterales bacterium]|nr:mechanosensitive ion channel family protein [Vicinamibacterales bacterium]